MIATVRRAAVALSTIAALAGGRLAAQSVLLSEVRADAQGRWIELHNRGASSVDLSTWSLHFASRTPSMPQNYWWAFPAGTTIAAGGFLRVHWYQAAPGVPGAGDVFTGGTFWDFLFGLGGEPLRGDRGALGLFRTQVDNQMNTPALVEDWVSWGDQGFPREQLAIANGRWTAGAQAPAIAPGGSIARNTSALAAGAGHAQQWFADASPTPLAPNLSGAAVTSHGQACAPAGHHLLGQPLLRAPSLPLLGNAQFGLALDHTTGIYGEFVLLAWSAGAAPPGQFSVLPPAIGGCAESIDLAQVFAVWLLPAQLITTHVPLSLAGMPPELSGSEAHVQAVVVDLLPYAFPPYQGVSNALQLVFGD
ncbi:MAG: lamin tail domain-containing protein [Planctomycetes bacterium]|nr:lamin tail domain-containing protein [Planctomycetota bacterium]